MVNTRPQRYLICNGTALAWPSLTSRTCALRRCAAVACGCARVHVPLCRATGAVPAAADITTAGPSPSLLAPHLYHPTFFTSGTAQWYYSQLKWHRCNIAAILQNQKCNAARTHKDKALKRPRWTETKPSASRRGSRNTEMTASAALSRDNWDPDSIHQSVSQKTDRAGTRKHHEREYGTGGGGTDDNVGDGIGEATGDGTGDGTDEGLGSGTDEGIGSGIDPGAAPDSAMASRNAARRAMRAGFFLRTRAI